MPDLTPQRQRVLREAETLKDALLVLGWRRSAIVEAIGKEDHDVPGAQP